MRRALKICLAAGLVAGLVFWGGCSSKKSDVRMDFVMGSLSGSSVPYLLYLHSYAYSNNGVSAKVTKWSFQIFAQGQKVLEVNQDNYLNYSCLPSILKLDVALQNDSIEVKLNCTGVTDAMINGQVWDTITGTYQVEDSNNNTYTTSYTGTFNFNIT